MKAALNRRRPGREAASGSGSAALESAAPPLALLARSGRRLDADPLWIHTHHQFPASPPSLISDGVMVSATLTQREPPVIPSNALKVLLGATRSTFALLTSAMHMAWLRYMGGRLKSDYRYSIGLVYNTFPMPPKGADLASLDPLAEAVLDAREFHPGATLADQYDPDGMDDDLRRAHRRLDRAVDRLYRPRKFTCDQERVEHLFTLYESMRTPLAAVAAKKNRRRRGRARAASP